MIKTEIYDGTEEWNFVSKRLVNADKYGRELYYVYANSVKETARGSEEYAIYRYAVIVNTFILLYIERICKMSGLVK